MYPQLRATPRIKLIKFNVWPTLNNYTQVTTLLLINCIIIQKGDVRCPLVTRRGTAQLSFNIIAGSQLFHYYFRTTGRRVLLESHFINKNTESRVYPESTSDSDEFIQKTESTHRFPDQRWLFCCSCAVAGRIGNRYGMLAAGCAIPVRLLRTNTQPLGKARPVSCFNFVLALFLPPRCGWLTEWIRAHPTATADEDDVNSNRLCQLRCVVINCTGSIILCGLAGWLVQDVIHPETRSVSTRRATISRTNRQTLHIYRDIG